MIKILNKIFNFFKILGNKTDGQSKTPIKEKLNSNLESEIFITRNILENNNFKLLANIYDYCTYSGIDGRLIIKNSHYFNSWDWTLDYNCQTGTAKAFGRICYVHELQQVLENNHFDIQIKV